MALKYFGRRRRSKSQTKKRKPLRKRVTKNRVITNTCKQVVNKILNKRAEVKHLSSNPNQYGWTNVPADNSLPFDAVNLASLYSMIEGDSDGERVGNRIYVKKADFCFNASAHNSPSTGPFIVDFWAGFVKPEQSFPPTPTQQLRLLQDGNSSTGQDNTTLKLLRGVNKDLFTIVNHRRFKLGTSEATSLVHSNNDFPLFRNFRISIRKLLGTMKYDDATSNPSKYMYVWFHCVRVDSALVAQAQCPEINYYLDMDYTDM